MVFRVKEFKSNKINNVWSSRDLGNHSWSRSHGINGRSTLSQDVIMLQR